MQRGKGMLLLIDSIIMTESIEIMMEMVHNPSLINELNDLLKLSPQGIEYPLYLE